MSCDAVVSAAALWLAAASPQAAPAPLSPEAATPAGAVAYEPLFADIVARARRLKAEAEGLKGKPGAVPADFKQGVGELSGLDMQAHLLLKQRGGDGDLKCILKGISEDLPLKLQALEAATAPKDRDMALSDMTYLLNDNVEVITAPPKPPV
jgi:hypothetical protein